MVGEQHVGTKLSLANGALGLKRHWRCTYPFDFAEL
jgi:hypothetical protein